MLKVTLLSVFAFCNIHLNDYFHKNQQILLNLEQSAGQKLIMAIKENDFHTVENIITNNLIEINEHYEGKTFVIWAGIYNKPEIVQMLVDFGADLSKRCDLGYTIEEHCWANESMKALSEIIVLRT